MSVATAQVDLSFSRASAVGAVTRVGFGASPGREDLTGVRQRAHRPQTVSPRLAELRASLLTTSDKSLEAEEVLLLLFSAVLEEEMARRLTQSCIQRFGSIGALFAARDSSLGEALDGEAEPFALVRCVHQLLLQLLREPLLDRPVLNDLPKLYDYLRVTLVQETHESVRLLFLNSRNALLKDELHSRGTINHTPVYPREIVRRVIEVNASALIIAHNHPSGDPSPSVEDVEITRLLKRVLTDIGVTLHDHVIVGKQRCESMHRLGLV